MMLRLLLALRWQYSSCASSFKQIICSASQVTSKVTLWGTELKDVCVHGH